MINLFIDGSFNTEIAVCEMVNYKYFKDNLL